MALKVIALDDASGGNELVEEARILSTLDSHPGLPTMRGDFFLDDVYVIVMDWIEGQDLAVLIEQRGAPGLAAATVIDYVTQAAAALDHLHHNQPPIVHGDVKPSNLVVTKSGKVVLVDLGLARHAGAVADGGSRGFIAPEVAAGEPSSAAADVYGLAATTVALLTGRPPGFDTSNFGDVDPAEAGMLRRTLALALATDPTLRPASAGALAERLRAVHRVLPRGVVTFVACEIVDAADLWDRDPDAMERVCERLDDLVSTATESFGGRVLASEAGDHMRAVFESAFAGVAAALAVQRGVASEHWPRSLPVRLRTAVHTGESEPRDGTYVGPAPVRVGRLRNDAPSGRTVVSSATAELVRRLLPEGARLVELSEDTSGERVFGLLGVGDEPFGVAPTVTEIPAVSASRSSASPFVAAAQPQGDQREARHAKLDNAVRNALEFAEQARRSGDEPGAARFEVTAQELAEQLVALEREMRQ